MVDMSKLTPAQRQKHAVMLLDHYHELCNMNDPSSTVVSPPPIPNIELFSQSTISSLDSGSFDRNQADGNNKQPTTSEVANTETVMASNEDIDTPPPQDTLNVFAVADLLSQSSYDTVKYKRAWHRAKVIRSFILSSGESPDAQSRSLSVTCLEFASRIGFDRKVSCLTNFYLTRFPTAKNKFILDLKLVRDILTLPLKLQ